MENWIALSSKGFSVFLLEDSFFLVLLLAFTLFSFSSFSIEILILVGVLTIFFLGLSFTSLILFFI